MADPDQPQTDTTTTTTDNPPPAVILDHDVSRLHSSPSVDGSDSVDAPSPSEPEEEEKTGRPNKALSMLSRASSRRSLTPGPPPDGGARAWLHVLAGHLCIVNAWGLASSFGAFQSYYTSTLAGASPSSISWIGTFQIFLLFFVGAVSGRALDAGLFFPVYVLGAVVQLVGIFMTSLCTRYWQLFLAQGVCVGLGNGLIFTPMLGLVSTYFARRRTIALAACATGGGTGGLVFPAVVRSLLPSVGFPWTMRTIAFVMLANHAVVLALARPRLPPRRSGPLVELGAFREVTYTAFLVGMFFNFWSLYFGFFYVGSYARNVVGLDYTASLNLLMVVNGVGVVGRLAPALLADWRFGALNTVTPFVLATSVIFFAWIPVKSVSGLYAWAAFYGFSNAGIQGLWPATLASLTPDPKYVGVRLGMGFTVVSFATLTGCPLGGALVGEDDGDYLYAQVWAGLCMAVGCACMVYARVASTGFVLWARI